MTNAERLKTLSFDDYQLEMQQIENNPCRKYINYDEWLNSNIEEYPITGKLGLYMTDDGVRVSCHIVGSKVKDGETFTRIVLHNGFHDFEQRLVSPFRVEEQ